MLEKEMATHSSVLAWRIPWTEKPGRLQSMGSHRVGHDWSDLAAANIDVDAFVLLKFLFIYLLCQVLIVACGIFDASCGVLLWHIDCLAHGLSSRGARA